MLLYSCKQNTCKINKNLQVSCLSKWKKRPRLQAPFWWGKVDSNHRSRRQQIYSLPHLTALEFPHIKTGAGGRIRTPDLLITNQLLYQLSYTSVEIGLPASYPLYAPKRRIMALKYNINSSGLCQAPFLPDGENFYGSAVRAFPLAFFAARL